MAKVYFAPFSAVKYVGTKAKVFNTSLARPKPVLKKGDIVIVDKVTAFNLVNKGFGEFVDVTEIEFKKADTENAEEFNSIESELVVLREQNAKLNTELLVALEIIAQADEDKELDEAFGVVNLRHNTRELVDELLATTTPAVSE